MTTLADSSPYNVQTNVRWGDMDALGHVNNARFFTYDEDVRLGFFNTLMADDTRFWKDYGLILANIGCDFVSQLHAPATLDIGYGITRIGSKSLATRALMYHDDRLVARTRAVVVWFDYRAQTTLAIPDGVRERLSRFMVSDDAA